VKAQPAAGYVRGEGRVERGKYVGDVPGRLRSLRRATDRTSQHSTRPNPGAGRSCPDLEEQTGSPIIMLAPTRASSRPYGKGKLIEKLHRRMRAPDRIPTSPSHPAATFLRMQKQPAAASNRQPESHLETPCTGHSPSEIASHVTVPHRRT